MEKFECRMCGQRFIPDASDDFCCSVECYNAHIAGWPSFEGRGYHD